MPVTPSSSPVVFTAETLRKAAELEADAYRPLWIGPSGEESTGEAVARHLDATLALLDKDGWDRVMHFGTDDSTSHIPADDDSMTVKAMLKAMLKALLRFIREDIAGAKTHRRTLFAALRHVGESDDGDSDTRDIAGEALTLLIQAHTGSPTARATPWSERLGRTHADITALLTAGARFARTHGPGAEAETAA
ncbi:MULTISPECIES: hypothetical protein [unclassified Streptomyces]|uniref:DUF6197 family protein n=1 Tax=unclassified Streptomyces TaxID=2593676 RepID=UPI00381EA3DB